MKTIILIVLLLGINIQLSAKEFKLSVNADKLIYGVVQKENPKRNLNAVGDKHMRNKAYGVLQIRKPYLQDAVKIAGKKEIQRKWKKKSLTMSDMKDRLKSKWVFRVYLSYYGKIYEKLTGKTPNMEVYARIHNGGPVGWKKKSTVSYGKAVLKNIKK